MSLVPLEEHEELARFQLALCELLFEDLSPAAIAARLRSDAAFAPFRRYVESFPPHLIASVGMLQRRWGRRGENPDRATTLAAIAKRNATRARNAALKTPRRKRTRARARRTAR
jgi:hypothetical protein